MDDKQVEAVARALAEVEGCVSETWELFEPDACLAITAYHTSTNNREQRMREALEAIATERWDSNLRGYDLALAAMDQIRAIRRQARAALEE